mmetsp:Transcript_81668/g.239771  ORF Transcript_81668/g.239771 Transcript_81668/m.239771 type:complete len:573 (-) Transcript_81668:240-1958(-)
MTAVNLFKQKAKEIVPMEYSQGDVSDALAPNKSKDEIVASLQSIGRKGEMSAMYSGYAADVAQMLTANTDPEVLAAALESLGNMGQAAADYSSDIAPYLQSSNSDVRAAAATALGMFGASSAPFAGTLTQMMKADPDEGAKCAAIGAIGQIGEESQAGPIVELLSSKSPVVVAAAVQALGELGTAGEAQAAGIAKKLDDPEVRYAAMCALSNLGESTIEKYMNEIISKCLSDKDSLTRTAAAEALGRISDAVAKSSSSMASIAAYLKHEDPGVKCAAALTFGYMSDKASGQADAIKLLLEDSAEDKSELYLTIGGGSMRSPPSARRPKCAALVALGMMGAGATADNCAECLTDDEWEVKMCALECLAQMGEDGKKQSSKISPCLEDDVFVVRTKACECVGALKDEDSAVNLPDLFEDKAPSVRTAALQALAECPEVAQDYSNEVFKCMQDQVLTVQAAAIYCLGSMGEIGKSYASVIATKLYNEDPGVRATACEALGKLGSHGAAFAEEVAASLEDDNWEVRMKAAKALGCMGPDGTPFLSELGFLTQDSFGEVSTAAREAVLALEQVGNGE